MSDTAVEVHVVLASIQAAGGGRHPSRMREFIHPEIAIVPPGLTETLRGCDLLVASFEEFCHNAIVLEYEETDEHIDVVGNCAVATFRFRMSMSAPLIERIVPAAISGSSSGRRADGSLSGEPCWI